MSTLNDTNDIISTPTRNPLRLSISRLKPVSWLVPIAVFGLFPLTAQAQDSTAIAVQQYEAEPGAFDIVNVQSARLQGHLDWQVGVHVNVADDPLEVRDPNDETLSRIIDSQTGIDLIGAIGIKDRYEIGLVLPFTGYRTHGDSASFVNVPMDLSSAAIGDIRVVPKVLIPGMPESFNLTLSAPLTIPTGKSEQFYGEGNVTVEPRLLADYRLDNNIRFAANLGLRLRSEKQFVNLTFGNEVTFGLATRVPFKLQNHEFAGLGTMVGSLGLAENNPEERPVEWLAGVEYLPTKEMIVRLAAGTGLTKGYGSPDFRVVLGFTFRRQAEKKPACLYGDEDMDGFEDDDKCADLDNDGDSIADTEDMCPNERETVNGIEDSDGCPENPVVAQGDMPALEQDKDSDGDGLLDDEDLCPQEPEDKDGHMDDDGCPDADNDKDTIVDTDDKCSLRAETFNSVDDEDGCPDEGKQLVVGTTSKIQILEKVYFDTNKATIKKRSFPLLDQVAAYLKTNPQITKLRIEGHTDNRGKDAYNMTLSQNRANSVRTYLSNRGVADGRMEAKGYGETRFIDTNKTRAGRANNRRVDFVILEVDGKPLPEDQQGSATGKELPTR